MTADLLASLRCWASSSSPRRVVLGSSGHFVLDGDIVLGWWNERRLRIELVDAPATRVDELRLRTLLEQVSLHDASYVAALLDAHVETFAR